MTGIENRYKMSQESLDKLKAELLQLETVRTKETMVSISATVYSNDPATRTLYLLVNGEEVRTQDVKFSE